MTGSERSKKSLGGVLGSRAQLQCVNDGDAGVYLKPALLRLTHRPFQHVEGRSFIYRGFIYPTGNKINFYYYYLSTFFGGGALAKIF